MMITNPVQAGSIANVLFISIPWLANILTRLITREGWGNLWLKPNFKRGWKSYLALWLLPFLATVVGGLAFYLLFPQSFDPSLGVVRKLAESSPATAMINPWSLLFSITLSLMFVSALINTVVSMGEEFGWRAYLLQKLMVSFSKPSLTGADPMTASAEAQKSFAGFSPAAKRKAALLTGVIHGVWHLPLILLTASMTPGVSVLTPLVYLLFTCSLSILLSWGTLNSGCVWPAALGHGVINAVSGLPGYLLLGQPISLIGPDPTGLIGGIGFTVLALILFFRKGYAGRPETIPGVNQAAIPDTNLVNR
jgi:membrane protease YdiL (CAAX protease family)